MLSVSTLIFVSPLQKLIRVFVYVQQNSKKVFTFVNIRLIIAYVMINDNSDPDSPGWRVFANVKLPRLDCKCFVIICQDILYRKAVIC